LLLNIRYVEANEQHPGRLALTFEKLSFRKKFELERQRFHGGFHSVTRHIFDNGKDGGEIQEKIVKKILPGHRLLVRYPFNSGNPLCLWLPESSKTGITLLISPLRASAYHQTCARFQKDFGAYHTAFISPNFKDQDRNSIRGNISSGKTKFLYIESESLMIRSFGKILTHILGAVPVNAVIIDESHCISEWGNDFKPSYLRIPDILSDIARGNPNLSVIALTVHNETLLSRDIMNILNVKEEAPKFPENFYQPNLSWQVLEVQSHGEKADAYNRLIQKDIPAAMKKQDIHKVLRDETGRKTGLLFCNPVRYHGKYIITKGWKAQYLVEPREIFSESEDFKAAEHAASGYPYYVISNPSPVSGDPEIWITTKDTGMGLDTKPARFVLQTLMADGIGDWYQKISRAGRYGENAHCVYISDLPGRDCEADMHARKTAIPECSAAGCVFGRENLCDYGKQHLLISHIRSRVPEETLQALRVLDELITCIEADNESASGSLFFRGKKKTELFLYRLLLIGVISGFYTDYQKGEFIFEVSGFNGSFDENAAADSILTYLKKNDIAFPQKYAAYTADQFFGAIDRISTVYGPEIDIRLQQHISDWEIRNYANYKLLFDHAAEYLPLLADHVYGSIETMCYHRLWNLKEFLKKKTCRYATLLAYFQCTDQNWSCGVCDNCSEDLNFERADRSPLSDHSELLDLDVYFFNLQQSRDFDLEAMNGIIEKFSAYPETIYLRALHGVEQSPCDIRLLYLSRAVSPEQWKGKHAVDLIKAANKDMPFQTVAALYETSPDAPDIRASQFDILDEEYGALNTPEGEEWLYNEAKKLSQTDSIDPSRLENLGARLVLNTLADFSSRKSELNKVLEEICHL
jgi:hypothetical protein